MGGKIFRTATFEPRHPDGSPSQLLGTRARGGCFVKGGGLRRACATRFPCLRMHTKGVMQQQATLRRALIRFFKARCFLEGFLEGACKGFQ